MAMVRRLCKAAASAKSALGRTQRKALREERMEEAYPHRFAGCGDAAQVAVRAAHVARDAAATLLVDMCTAHPGALAEICGISTARADAALREALAQGDHASAAAAICASVDDADALRREAKREAARAAAARLEWDGTLASLRAALVKARAGGADRVDLDGTDRTVDVRKALALAKAVPAGTTVIAHPERITFSYPRGGVALYLRAPLRAGEITVRLDRGAP